MTFVTTLQAIVLLGLPCAGLFSGEPAVPATTTPAPTAEITDPRYLLDLAQTHLNHNSIERAEPLIRQAITHLPAADAALKARSATLLARVLEKKNDAAGAAEQYEAVIKASTEPTEKVNLLLALARTRDSLKEFDKAAAALNEASAVVRGNPGNQSLIWMQREVSRRLVELLGKDPERLAAATGEAEAALAKDPKDLAALERLSDIHMTVKPDAVKAIAYQERIVEQQPESQEALSRLSTLYMQARRMDKAIEVSKKLASIAPKEQKPQYAFQAALLLVQGGKKDEAVKVMEDIVGNEPVTDRVATLLATIYEQAGKLELAGKSLRAAASISKRPEEKITLSLRAADIDRRRKDYKTAEETLRAVLKEFKDDKNAQDSARAALAQIYREQGKEKELKFD